MISSRVRVLPVVDAAERLVGVVSRGDVLRANAASRHEA
jgi:CBS domain-containing protein